MARLIYLMGPSGSGKDALLDALRARHRGDPTLRVAQRYINRPWQAGGENHVELSAAEFDRRQNLGLFALSWYAHGRGYGISCEVEAWLAAGQDVLVNGSRGYLAQARLRFGTRLQAVLLRVDEAILRARLQARGRESDAEIETRLARAREYSGVITPDTRVIDNNGPLEQAVAAFERLLENA